MKLTALFLTFLSIFFVLISWIPALIVPAMALSFGLFFIIIALLLGIITQCRFVWLTCLLLLLLSSGSGYLLMQRTQDYLNERCDALILEGNYKVSDYIIKHTGLGYQLPSEEGEARIAMLMRCAEAARQAEATAISQGANQAEVKAQIAAAVSQVKGN